MWSPSCKPIVLAIYTVQNKQNAKRREDVLATITRAVFDEFAKHDNCSKK
jgi:beta-lactamase class A